MLELHDRLFLIRNQALTIDTIGGAVAASPIRAIIQIALFILSLHDLRLE